MESQRRSERTKAGLRRRAVAQGRQVGRPSDPRDKKKRKKRSPKLLAFPATGF
jgi:hypothetical protein